MSSQKITTCVLTIRHQVAWHQVAWHFAATNLFVRLVAAGKILLWRQEFKKNVWNKQKAICPRNITYCSNMLLHLAIKCSNLLHISTEKWSVLNFSIEVVNKRSSYFTHVVGNFAWHIPFHLAHQQSSAWQYKHGLWSLNPLLFQNCHLWLWLKEQGSWLCTMHC